MKIFILVNLFYIINFLHASEVELNNFNYPADYTAAPLKLKSKKIDVNKYYQKVVLDHDNVYRLKTFKKDLAKTPSVLKQMVDLETRLYTIGKIKLTNRINRSLN